MEELGFDPTLAVSDSLNSKVPGEPVAPQPTLQMSMAQAVGTKPDYQAELARVARKTGVPVDTVAAFPDELKKKATLGEFDFDGYQKMFPASAAMLSNIDFAKIAHDDTENMGAVEKITTSFNRGLTGTLRGGDAAAITESTNILSVIDRIESGELKDDVQIANATPYASLFAGASRTPEHLAATRAFHEQRVAENLLEFARRTKEIKNLKTSPDYQKFTGAKGASESFKAFGEAPVSITGQVLSESIGGMLPSLPLIAGGGAVAGVKGLMGATGLTSFGTEYVADLANLFDSMNVDMSNPKAVQEAMKRPEFIQGNRQALIKAGVVGAFDAATAGVTGIRLTKNPIANVAGQTVTQMAGGAGGEAAGSVASGQEVNASSVLAEAIGEVPGGFVEMATAGAHNRAQVREAAKAEENAQTIEQASQVAAASKVRERDPESFRQLVEKAQEKGDVKELYINPQDLQQSGADLGGLSQVSPSVQEQLAKALATGEDIKVPLPEYMANIAPTEYAQLFSDFARTEPGGMNRLEAQEFIKNQTEELRTQVDKIMADKQTTDNFKASSKAVYDDIFKQLNEAGRFTPDVNKDYATLHSNFATVYGAKLGITPEEFYKTYYPQENKFVQAQSMTGGATLDLNQEGTRKTETPEFKNWFGDSKVVDKEGKPLVVYHGRRRDFQRFEENKVGGENDGGVLGAGFYFDTDKKVASYYGSGEGGNVAPAYVALQQPYAVKEGSTSRQQDGGVWKTETLLRQYQEEHPEDNLSELGLDSYREDFATSDKELGVKIREMLEGQGYDGVVFEFSDGNKEVVAFKPEQIKSVFNKGTFDPNDPNILNQDTEGKRGSFNPSTSTITLLAKADLSTFLHESGHFFLETLNRIAQDPNAPAEVKQDMDTTLKWFGIEADGKPAGGSKEGEFNQGEPSLIPAIRWKNKIYRAETHLDALAQIDDTKERAAATLDGDNRVYVTERGKILDRYKAQDYARNFGLFREDAPAWVSTAQELASEYLKPKDLNILNQGGEEGTKGAQPSGRTRLEVWNSMSLEEQRVYHEQFARGFEAYLFEGRAPSLEMQGVFSRFAAWMKKVYASIRDLNVELNADVRGVFDRMLASAEQIKEAEALRRFEPMFKTAEEAGMTPEQFKEYYDTSTNASIEANHQLEKRALRDMKWLSNGRSKIIKKIQAEADTKRKAVRQEVTDQVRSEPLYKAMRWLKRGEMVDAEGNEVKAEKGFRLNIDDVKAMYPETMNGRPNTDKLGVGQYGMLAKDGLHPDVVAEMFGFPSGDALVRALVAAEPEAQVIDALTDKTMLERYGDLIDKDQVEKAADRAIHNEARIRFVATEMAALEKQNGSAQELTRLAKAAAQSAIGQVKVNEINPKRFIAAGVRASKAADKAFKAGNRAEAIRQKRLQLFHVAMTKEAIEANATTEKALLKFRKLFRKDKVLAKNHDMKLISAARAVLGAYSIGGKVNGVVALEDLKKVKEYDPELYAQIEPVMSAALQGAGEYSTLPYGDFKAMIDAVNQIVYSAKRTKQVRIDGQLVSKKEVTAALRKRLDEIGVPENAPGAASAVTDAERRKWTLQGLASAMRRVEAWADLMDGTNPNGAFRKYIFNPISNAITNYRTAKNRVLKEYVALLREKQAEFHNGKIAAPEISYTFEGKNELLGALLHIGNSSNKRKLLLGRGWGVETTTAAGEKVLDTTKMDAFLNRMMKEGTLNKSDFDFLQKVWDLMESIKPDAQKAHYDMYGHYFSEITAEPVYTPFGTYKGGYAPAVADKELTQDVAMKNEANAIEEGFNYMMPSTATGFTKGRVEYNKPLLMDLRLVAAHIDQALRFTYVQPSVRDALRIIRSPAFANAMQKINPTTVTDMLMPWLHRSASQMSSTPFTGQGGKALDKFLRALRKRTGMVAMTANFVNALQQLTGITIAAVKVKPRYLKGSLMRYMAAPSGTAETISGLSPWMAERLSGDTFELNNAMNQILEDETAWQKVKDISAKHSHFAQRAMQNVVDIVTWQGAFDQASETMTQKEAVQFADSTVRLTQGSTSPEDIARFEAGNTFTQLFTQFTGYFNMQANLLGTEFKKAMRDMGGDKKRLAYVYAMGFMLPAVLADAIVRTFGWDWDDEDHDGYLDELFAWFFGSQLRAGVAMFPVVGGVGNAAVNRLNKQPFDDRISTAPAVSTLESATAAPFSLYAAATGKGKDSKAVNDVLTLLTMATGVPFTAVSRPLKYAADVEQHKAKPANAADAARGAISGKGREAERVHIK